MSVIIDEAVAKALTSNLVSDELAALDLPDGGEERPDLLLQVFGC